MYQINLSACNKYVRILQSLYNSIYEIKQLQCPLIIQVAPKEFSLFKLYPSFFLAKLSIAISKTTMFLCSHDHTLCFWYNYNKTNEYRVNYNYRIII